MTEDKDKIAQEIARELASADPRTMPRIDPLRVGPGLTVDLGIGVNVPFDSPKAAREHIARARNPIAFDVTQEGDEFVVTERTRYTHTVRGRFTSRVEANARLHELRVAAGLVINVEELTDATKPKWT